MQGSNETEEVAPSTARGDVWRVERRALGWAALAALVIIVWLVSPVGIGVLLGLLLAFVLRPIYTRVARRVPPPAAALAMVIGSTLVVTSTFGGLLWIVIRDGTAFAGATLDWLRGRGPHEIASSLGAVTERIGVPADALNERANALVARAAGLLAQLPSMAGQIALALFFQALTTYFVLRRWERIVIGTEVMLPLRPDYTLKLLGELRRVGQATLLSTVVIGLLQGVLATIAYAIVGLPKPLFLGVLTSMAALVPGLGTTLVWVPAGVVLLVRGHAGAGVFLLAWGVVVLTSIPTYVIQPRLVGRGSDVPSLFTFIALFGGAAVFGLKGLVVGPVLMALAVAILRIYAGEAEAARPVLTRAPAG